MASTSRFESSRAPNGAGGARSVLFILAGRPVRGRAVSDALRLRFSPRSCLPRCVPHGRAWRCVLSRHFRRTVPKPFPSCAGSLDTAFMMRSGCHRPGRIAFQWPSSLHCPSHSCPSEKARSTSSARDRVGGCGHEPQRRGGRGRRWPRRRRECTDRRFGEKPTGASGGLV